MSTVISYLFFFFNDTATTEIYTLSLHDALPISRDLALPDGHASGRASDPHRPSDQRRRSASPRARLARSEEHTSELQSRLHLVCRLLLEKKKTTSCIPSTNLSTTSVSPPDNR